jgi:polyhydroxybutyrate depolymerase
MRRAWASIAVVTVLLTAGCQRPLHRQQASPDREVTVETAEGGRTAIIHHPANVTGAASLVVMLHGGFGTADQAKKDYGWDALADGKGFIVAYPDGHIRSWNVGPECCGRANSQGYHDADFLHALVGQLVKEDGVDPAHVYAVGMSNGAMMTYAWACTHPEDLAGIGPVAGSRLLDCPKAKPMRVVAIHGTADRNIPIAGGVGPKGVTGVDNPSLGETLTPFMQANGCQPRGSVTESRPVRTTHYPCTRGFLETVIVDGWGHQWPGSAKPGKIGEALGLDDPYPDLDATALLWTELTATH